MSNSCMEHRWGLFIDIEGFSHRYSKNSCDALLSLGCLAGDLFQIGKYFTEHERLLIHQFGDGFLVLSDFPEDSLNRPLSIAIALMQSMLLRGREGGGVCRAAISTGDFSDVSGCLPPEVREDKSFDHHFVKLGDGLMTLIPVMGSALINPYKLQSKGPKGPLLFVDAKLDCFMPTKGVSILHRTKDSLQVDWLHARLPLASELLGCLRGKHGKMTIPDSLLEEQLSKYVKTHCMNGKWASSAQELISGAYFLRKDQGQNREGDRQRSKRHEGNAKNRDG